MQNRPDLRLPPPKQTVKMDLSAIMKEVIAQAPIKSTRSTGALPPDPLAGRPQPARSIAQGHAPGARDLSLLEFDEVYGRLFSRLGQGLKLGASQWSALRHTSFALALGGLVEGDVDSVLRFLTRVRDRTRVHLEGGAGLRLTPIQARVVSQLLQTFQNVA